MWFVYILQSQKNNRYYIGCSNNLERRLEEHNKGYNKSTKNNIPYKIIYVEDYSNQQVAYKREKQIKSYKGGEAFKKLISVGGRVVNYNRL